MFGERERARARARGRRRAAPWQGLYDLRDKLLRTPLEAKSTLLDDPLRVLRGVRFATVLGFQLAPEMETVGAAPARSPTAAAVECAAPRAWAGLACTHVRRVRCRAGVAPCGGARGAAD